MVSQSPLVKMSDVSHEWVKWVTTELAPLLLLLLVLLDYTGAIILLQSILESLSALIEGNFYRAKANVKDCWTQYPSL